MYAHLNDTQRQIKETADRFSREMLLPRYMAREREENNFERSLVREMGSMGLLAPTAPSKWGGMGLDCVTTGVICESVGYGDFNYAYLPLAASLAIAILDANAKAEVAEDVHGFESRQTRHCSGHEAPRGPQYCLEVVFHGARRASQFPAGRD
jgi:alkylation response protein AidB-like acyl-CoA dehydrogenase